MNRKKYFLLSLITIVLVTFPLIFIGGEFQGTDALAEELVSSINPDYELWFESILPELGGEMETFLFTLQAAIGAGVVGYILGNMRGKTDAAKQINCIR